MNLEYIKVKGTKDYYFEEALKLEFVISKLKELATNNYFSPLKFPLFEHQNLFIKTIGEETDIVNKEMFKIIDRKNRTIVLRPEGTASTMRVVLENKLSDLKGDNLRFYYLENMFRYERPQKGRQREFLQFGIEYLNSDSIYSDFEILLLANSILEKFEIKNYVLEINSIGSLDTRQKYIKALKEYLKKFETKLSQDSKNRLKTNILRILDSKENVDKKILENAPKIIDFLTEDEKNYLLKISKFLEDKNIKFKINPFLVRGLDYYNDLVFEFVSNDNILGAQATIIGGGRYDGLMTHLDQKKSIKAIGFALGIERLMLLSNKFIEKNYLFNKKYIVLPIDNSYFDEAFKVLFKFRNQNKITAFNFSSQKFTKKLLKAVKDDFDFAIIVGKEIKNNRIILRDLKQKTQQEIKI